MQSSIYKLNPKKWQLKKEDDFGDVYLSKTGIAVVVRAFRDVPQVPEEFTKKSVLEYYDKKVNPRFAFGLMKRSTGIRNVDIKLCIISNIKCFLTIYALPQSDPGLLFLGTLTVPFKRSCIEVKCQLAETGLIGYRETVVASTHGSKVDPFSLDYDKEFPDHPLSIVRRTIYQVVKDLSINSLKRPPFYD